MKKFLLAATSLLLSFSIFATEPETVNEKVLKAFEQSFKDAVNVSWHEYENYYEVKFVHNQIDSRLTYDMEGNILKSRRYYSEEHLPLFIRAKLQKEHKDKKVFGITELAEEGELDYYIVLESATNWYHVKCNSTGIMSVYKKYKKA